MLNSQYFAVDSCKLFTWSVIDLPFVKPTCSSIGLLKKYLVACTIKKEVILSKWKLNLLILSFFLISRLLRKIYKGCLPSICLYNCCSSICHLSCKWLWWLVLANLWSSSDSLWMVLVVTCVPCSKYQGFHGYQY